MGKIVKKVKKIIPKEIKPALPFVAAYFGGPMLASKFAMNPLISSLFNFVKIDSSFYNFTAIRLSPPIGIS